MVRAIIFGLWRGADKLPLVPPRLVTDVRMKDELKILKGKWSDRQWGKLTTNAFSDGIDVVVALRGTA